MKKHVCIQCLALFLFEMFGPKCACSSPPHIIFMLIDDLGWNDVSFHGSPQIPTPNIDTLAYSGVILNNYYVQPLCTPSRGSLMTGKYPIRLGLQHFVIGAGEPWGLSPKEILLPQYLKDLGYVTRGVGKWHLGYFKNEYRPTKRGFDSFFGFYEGKGDHFTHFDIEEEQSGLDFHDDEKHAWNYFGYYATDAFTDRAKRIIRSHNTSKPLFLYLAHQAVHAGNEYFPLQAPKEYIDLFSHIKDEERRTFAAMAYSLDKSVGEVFSALHEKNMLENSIIIFTSDNGGAVQGIDESTGSNWPLRGSKYNLWEGGVRGTAFIWSQLLSKSRESISMNLMHISDWLPTLYAAAGGKTTKLGEIDGCNFWPSLNGNLSSPRDHILLNIDSEWKTEAIRKNQFKLLKGSVFSGNFDGWFDKEGKREGVPFNDEELDTLYKIYKNQLHESEVYQILKKCNKDFCFHFDDSSSNGNLDLCDTERNQHEKYSELSNNNEESFYMRYFSHPVEVQCGSKPANASTNCLPLEDYCLFDVEKDPCEYNNLATTLPSITEELKQLLDEYRKKVVPIRNKPIDPNANPKYHGYMWVSWAEEKSINVL